MYHMVLFHNDIFLQKDILLVQISLFSLLMYYIYKLHRLSLISNTYKKYLKNILKYYNVMNSLFKDMIKSKVGMVLLIIFFLIGYFYIKSIFLGLLLAPAHIKILAYLYIVLFSLNFALISFMIINYRKFYPGNILAFISAIFGFAGFQACLVGCSTGSFAILVGTLAPIFGLNIYKFGELLLIVSDILFIISLIFLLGLNKRKDIKKLKIPKSIRENLNSSCCNN
mgnify:CR=1 FL=1